MNLESTCTALRSTSTASPQPLEKVMTPFGAAEISKVADNGCPQRNMSTAASDIKRQKHMHIPCLDADTVVCVGADFNCASTSTL